MLARVAFFGVLLGILFVVCFSWAPELAIVPGVALFALIGRYAWIDAQR